MTDYQLLDELYLLPTAAGAFYAASSRADDPIRDMLFNLLREGSSPLASPASLTHWFANEDQQQCLAWLHRAQTLSLIQGFREPQHVPGAGTGKKLEDLLPALSALGKAILVDWNGLTLAYTGLDAEAADMLAALSADLIAVQARHAQRLAQTLGLGNQGWAAVDAFGSSRIGAWPLFVNEQRFMLVVLGEPQLNCKEFIELVWVLVNRYG